MARITVLGCGFGTALAVMADKAGHKVTLWSKFPEEIEAIRQYGEHRKLLPGVPVPATINLTTDLSAAANSDLVLLVPPTRFVREVARHLRPILPPDIRVVCLSKGLELGSLKRMDEVISEEIPNPVVILSGPSHAEEIARGVPTVMVSASANRKDAEYVQDILMNQTLRIYVSDDMIGVELGAALKNIIALAVGICDGMKVGDNTKAALMTRGMTEIARLGVKLGAQTETFAGLSGVGDLIVTCTSMHSRNRRAGILIGEGMAAAEAVEKVGTVEGYFATEAAYQLSQRTGVSMPITTQLYEVLYGGQSVRAAIESLMVRPRRHESETVWLNEKA